MDENQWEKVHEHYFTNFKLDEFKKEFSLLKTQSEYIEILSSFEHNITSVISILSLPLTISQSRTKLLLFDNYYKQELILNAPEPRFGVETEDEKKKALQDDIIRKENALNVAKKRFFDETYTEEGAKKYRNITYEFLFSLYEKKEVSLAISELLNQSCVLLWSVFEILARDFFIVYLNKNNNKVELLNGYMKSKKIINNISLEILSSHSFNLSNDMGTMLESNIEFSRVENIREVYKLLFPYNSELVTLLSDKMLWKINQQRNLLVHKKGIVDKRYFESTDDDTPIGKVIIITPHLIKQYIEFIKNIGLCLLSNA